MTHPADYRVPGCLPSPPDRRDFPARAFLPRTADPVPNDYDLPFTVDALDQGLTGMCNAFAEAVLKTVQEWDERGVRTPYSPGYIYGNRLPGQYQGEGMYPREGLATLVKCGIAPLDVLPVTGTYEECRDAYLAKQAEADRAALPQRVLSYVLCTTAAEAQGAIYHLRSPVLIGSNITKMFSWVTGADGIVRDEPADHFDENSPSYWGCHAMIIIGWRQLNGRLYWVVQNSWGPGWADHGRCLLPADWPGLLEMWAITDRHPAGRRVRFDIGSNVATLTWPQPGGPDLTDTMALDVPAQIVGNRLVLPVRAESWALSRLLTPGEPWPGDLIPLPITDATGRVQAVEIVIPSPE